MELKDTNFGKIVIELNDFVDMVQPSIVAKLEGMEPVELAKLVEEDSLMGVIAARYQKLIKAMQIVSA